MDMREISVRCTYCGRNYTYQGSEDPGCCGLPKCEKLMSADPFKVQKTQAGESAIQPITFGKDTVVNNVPKRDAIMKISSPKGIETMAKIKTRRMTREEVAALDTKETKNVKKEPKKKAA